MGKKTRPLSVEEVKFAGTITSLLGATLDDETILDLLSFLNNAENKQYYDALVNFYHYHAGDKARIIEKLGLARTAFNEIKERVTSKHTNSLSPAGVSGAGSSKVITDNKEQMDRAIREFNYNLSRAIDRLKAVINWYLLKQLETTTASAAAGAGADSSTSAAVSVVNKKVLREDIESVRRQLQAYIAKGTKFFHIKYTTYVKHAVATLAMSYCDDLMDMLDERSCDADKLVQIGYLLQMELAELEGFNKDRADGGKRFQNAIDLCQRHVAEYRDSLLTKEAVAAKLGSAAAGSSSESPPTTGSVYTVHTADTIITPKHDDVAAKRKVTPPPLNGIAALPPIPELPERQRSDGSSTARSGAGSAEGGSVLQPEDAAERRISVTAQASLPLAYEAAPSSAPGVEGETESPLRPAKLFTGDASVLEYTGIVAAPGPVPAEAASAPASGLAETDLSAAEMNAVIMTSPTTFGQLVLPSIIGGGDVTVAPPPPAAAPSPAPIATAFAPAPASPAAEVHSIFAELDASASAEGAARTPSPTVS